MATRKIKRRIQKQVVGMAGFYSWSPAVDDGSFDDYDSSTGVRVLEVRSIQSLIQLIGYVKYNLSEDGCRVLYRGQTDLYETGNDATGCYRFQPSALREITKQDAYNREIEAIRRTVDAVRSANHQFKEDAKFPDPVIEGLLQQYGIPTTWIDVSDNVWTALWFACYRTIWNVFTKNDNGKRRYCHMTLRTVGEAEDGKDYAYLFVLAAEGKLGEEGKCSEWLDLREAIPSTFIRPHAQHGCLMRMKAKYGPNMVSLVRGIIRVRLRDALSWLGGGRMLLPDSMVPPPNYDSGFRQLLQSETQGNGIRYPIYC